MSSGFSSPRKPANRTPLSVASSVCAGWLSWLLPASRTRIGATIFFRRFLRLPLTNRDTSGALGRLRLRYSEQEYIADKKRKKLTLRQFHKEGLVNEYIEQEPSSDGKSLVLVSERIENIPDGWRARETYKFVSQDEYGEVFELADLRKNSRSIREGTGNGVK